MIRIGTLISPFFLGFVVLAEAGIQLSSSVIRAEALSVVIPAKAGIHFDFAL